MIPSKNFEEEQNNADIVITAILNGAMVGAMLWFIYSVLKNNF